MNTQKFLNNGQNRFPLSTDTLDFMQNQSLLLQGFASAFGDNYIIKQPASSSVDGLIVINGELLPLKYGSGTSSSYIAIVTEKTDINANGLTFPQARTVRYASGVGTNQGGECYSRSTFFEVRKQQALPLERGLTDCVVDSSRAIFPNISGMPNLRCTVREGGIFHINGYFNTKPSGFSGTDFQRIATLPTTFPRPKYRLRFTGKRIAEELAGDLFPEPYELCITPTGNVELTGWCSTPAANWIWVSERFDMLRYF